MTEPGPEDGRFGRRNVDEKPGPVVVHFGRRKGGEAQGRLRGAVSVSGGYVPGVELGDGCNPGALGREARPWVAHVSGRKELGLVVEAAKPGSAQTRVTGKRIGNRDGKELGHAIEAARLGSAQTRVTGKRFGDGDGPELG